MSIGYELMMYAICIDCFCTHCISVSVCLCFDQFRKCVNIKRLVPCVLCAGVSYLVVCLSCLLVDLLVPITDLLADADDKLFESILANGEHILHNYIPERARPSHHHHHLRPRKHSKELIPKTRRLNYYYYYYYCYYFLVN